VATLRLDLLAWVVEARRAYLLRSATVKAATHLLDHPVWEEKGRHQVWVVGARPVYLPRPTRIKAADHLLDHPVWEEKGRHQVWVMKAKRGAHQAQFRKQEARRRA
jgi:hypothetical protein